MTFTALMAGAYFLITGLVGYNLDRTYALRAMSRWTGHPIPGQIVLGVALLAIGIYFVRRLNASRWIVIGRRPERQVKNAGKGRSSGAERRRSLPESTPDDTEGRVDV
jgi:hypothetical protein